jgi:hypothetical protein
MPITPGDAQPHRGARRRAIEIRDRPASRETAGAPMTEAEASPPRRAAGDLPPPAADPASTARRARLEALRRMVGLQGLVPDPARIARALLAREVL